VPHLSIFVAKERCYQRGRTVTGPERTLVRP